MGTSHNTETRAQDRGNGVVEKTGVQKSEVRSRKSEDKEIRGRMLSHTESQSTRRKREPEINRVGGLCSSDPGWRVILD